MPLLPKAVADEGLEHPGDRESHHVEIVPLHSGHPPPRGPLDAVPPRFVIGFTGPEVSLELEGRDGPESDAAGDAIAVEDSAPGAHQGQARHDLMGPVREGPEHPESRSGPRGFAEDPATQDHFSVATQDPLARMEGRYGHGLGEGQPLHEGPG